MSLLDRIKQALGIRSPSQTPLPPHPKEKEEPPQAEPCGGTMERTSAPMTYKLGSLFDGSGGFPLAGSLCGITPVWAAEVEPYPIAVTRSRFPDMRHLGDISKVSGAQIEPVDIITFGSPCQDLSVAGKRAGLKHEANGDEETTRSGLFMEAVRIIKEMREATNGAYPRFALWENVPGAFSSNKGEDFRIVCEELIKIVEPAAVMPAVPKNGWAYADSYCGDGWSLAYRVFDAQYWGVPQRRRRIHLVVDFTGQCARDVLFERQGVRGYFETSRKTRQGTASNAERGAGAADREGETAVNVLTPWDSQGNQVIDATDGHKFPTLRGCGGAGYQAGYILAETDCKGVGLDIYNLAVTGDKAASLTTATGQGASNTGPSVAVPYTLKIRSGCEGGGKGALVQEDKSATLATNNDQYLFQPVTGCVYSVENHPADSRVDIDESGKVQCLTSRMGTGGGNVPMVMEPVISIQGNTIDRNAQQNGSGVCENVTHTLNAVDRHGVAYATDVGFFNTLENRSPALLARMYKDPRLITYAESKIRYIVRRLTPTECARLQGFADCHGHIEQKDSLTAEEYAFWLEVRNTHAAINGKVVKEYTEKQMLTWYNKLHTDSAEYKMWGNGIALPPALYCMQGIMDALRKEEETA